MEARLILLTPLQREKYVLFSNVISLYQTPVFNYAMELTILSHYANLSNDVLIN